MTLLFYKTCAPRASDRELARVLSAVTDGCIHNETVNDGRCDSNSPSAGAHIASGEHTRVTGVAEALANGKLLLYQTLESNHLAVRIALSLGFDRYANHLAVRLNREAREP